ncbi:hypothetical protein M2152_001491 [Microbacteriaceae bacterium SG_E_30_P1]|uniref:Secreted protein n=1 Tax=Antiquaquibacter oligotrophicus TaxID=2880260 RepID=A0ABT6KN71_9MICO|nr:hypothetical protein [Antiquaquibacter oligotrophicus]MDH6181309.1 hypothetical protein [Antiquaquibacter oligotrophicus]UDF12998.1 hypothetical protein LH407_12660 [Antiquaquibacter oligotrophicus]
MKKYIAALVAVATTFVLSALPLAAHAQSSDGSNELAATGSALGAFELFVGGAGAVMLIGATLLVIATRRRARDTSAH